MKCLSRGAGYTLIELLAVLVLLCIVAAITGVSVSRQMDKSRIKDEAMRLRNTMRHARDLSIVERIPYIVIVNSSESSYTLMRADEQGAKPHALPRGISIEDGAEVVFWPKGNSTGGAFVIRDEHERRYEVYVEVSTGASRLSRL